MTQDGPRKAEMSLWGHLEELRKRLIISFTALAAATAGSFFISARLLEFLTRPLRASGGTLYFFSPQEAFLIRLKASFISGLLLASPILASQIWFFMAPALLEKEKKLFGVLVLAAVFLFATGLGFAFWGVLPVGMQFLLGMGTDFLKPMISVTQYMDFLFMMLLAFGIAFNMPLFIWGVVRLGFMDARSLIKYQRHAIVGIFILAAVLTPGPDIASQLLLAVPLVVLFELSTLLALLGAWKGKKVRVSL